MLLTRSLPQSGEDRNRHCNAKARLFNDLGADVADGSAFIPTVETLRWSACQN